MKNKILEILEKYKTILYDSSHNGEIIRGIQPDDFDKIVNEIIMVIEPTIKPESIGTDDKQHFDSEMEECDKCVFKVNYEKFHQARELFEKETSSRHQENDIVTKEIMFSFIDWLYSAHYSKYWGNDEPNNGKWYKGYTNPDRQYFTLKELFTMAIETKK